MLLKNYPWQAAHLAKQPLVIHQGDVEWEAEYKLWQNGKNPTSNPAWKEGVFFSLEDK